MAETVRGRPRSETARRAVFEAVLGLVEERGYAALTIEAIAARSGVGRPTIYRWWNSKGQLLSEAYLERTAANPDYTIPDHGNLLDDLLYFIPRLVQNLAGVDGRVVLAIMLEAQLVEDFEAGFRVLMQQRWKASEELFVRSLRRGELDQIPPAVVYECLYGAMFQRLLTRRAPLDWAYGQELARAIHRMLLPDRA